MTLYFAAARTRGNAAACARLSKTDLNLGFVTRWCQGMCPSFLASGRRHRALFAKAGHGPLDRRRQKSLPLLVQRFVTRLRQPCNSCDSACGATNDKCAFMMRFLRGLTFDMSGPRRQGTLGPE